MYPFSDEFQPLFQYKPLRYLRNDVKTYELQKLKNGYYIPEIFLDLHGLTQQEAKNELSLLILNCFQKQIFCANIITGHGRYILKNKTPFWLAQHPQVMAFHQAPKIFGGQAAILVLIETQE